MASLDLEVLSQVGEVKDGAFDHVLRFYRAERDGHHLERVHHLGEVDALLELSDVGLHDVTLVLERRREIPVAAVGGDLLLFSVGSSVDLTGLDPDLKIGF